MPQITQKTLIKEHPKELFELLGNLDLLRKEFDECGIFTEKKNTVRINRIDLVEIIVNDIRQ